jgi:tryptophanyl-tRNA synthetase
MRVLSGIQPTGRFHWGNYFGAIRQYIDLQHEDEAYYFIANLHALTTVREPARLQELTLDAASTWWPWAWIPGMLYCLFSLMFQRLPSFVGCS